MTSETLTQDQAIAMAKSGWWKDKTAREIVGFQLFEERLCMPFGDFHKAVEEALGRSVWTHEFASSVVDRLRAEFLGERQPPSGADIIALAEELAPGKVITI